MLCSPRPDDLSPMTFHDEGVHFIFCIEKLVWSTDDKKKRTQSPCTKSVHDITSIIFPILLIICHPVIISNAQTQHQPFLYFSSSNFTYYPRLDSIKTTFCIFTKSS